MSRLRRRRGDDRGSVMILLLVMMVVGSLIVLPLMSYTVAVHRSSEVQTDKSRALQLAKGGLWVAVHDPVTVFDACGSAVKNLPSSLVEVTTTCQVVDQTALYAPDEMPYTLALVEAGATIPSGVTSSDPYANPSTPADVGAWIADASDTRTADHVWLPTLPVPLTRDGESTVTFMPGDAMEPGYTACDVYFPGTYDQPIRIDGPAYFVSGVYHFTENIVLANGADVVVGNGAAGGCTSDFIAAAEADSVPSIIGHSGYGATFVLGDGARVLIDDTNAANGPIRFVMNQRYVNTDDTSVLASAGVSIISVNGTHEPYEATEVSGDDLVVPDVTHVPASTVGATGDLAVDSGYVTSTVTAKPRVPDAPSGVTAVAGRLTGSSSTRGTATVSWAAPNANGSTITGYRAITNSGAECTAPVGADGAVATSCVIFGLSNNVTYSVTVTAENSAGTSDASEPTSVRPIFSGTGASPVITAPSAPASVSVMDQYTDGLAVQWAPPATDGGAPVEGYTVTATPLVGTPTTCTATWNESWCVLAGLDPLAVYDIGVVATSQVGSSTPTSILALDMALLSPATQASPSIVPVSATPVPVTPIIDVTAGSGAPIDIEIAGYVAVPQGHIVVDGGADPSVVHVVFTGGLLAGQLIVPSKPATLVTDLDNPVAQKIVKIVSVTTGSHTARSDAVVQINASGSMAVNSWSLQ